MKRNFSLNCDIALHVPCDYNQDVLCNLAKETIARSRVGGHIDGKEIILNVAFVDGSEIQRVNTAFRGKDRETDVISIGDFADDRNIAEAEEGVIDLGELVLCLAFIENSATILNEDPAYEFAYVFSHGVLHLLGYDHGEEMYALQDELAHAYADELTT